MASTPLEPATDIRSESSSTTRPDPTPDHPFEVGTYDGQIGLPSGCCYLNGGKTVSQGVDIEFNGEVTRNLQISASYAYNHNKDKQAGVAYNTVSAPRHLFKLWGRYKFEGALSRFAGGGGLNVTSSVYSRGATSDFVGGGAFYIKRPAYEIFDGFAEYAVNDQVKLALNLSNILNKKYYSSIEDSTFGTFFGPPRSFTVTMRGSF